ncbi:MAG: beta-galactosidase, partial [Chloroflexota bacterium]
MTSPPGPLSTRWRGGTLPTVAYGAVYFRKSNPPPEDWARDYQTAAEDGMNVFRHWFLWSAIEIAPGEYDWDDYDRQLDLAAQYGIQTVIAEMLTAAPEWAWQDYAHARFLDAAGRPAHSQISGSCATGGFPGLCLDNDDARALGQRFLTALASRYRAHPALLGYDVWNECNVSRQYCYCPATLERFRQWLRERYDSPRDVGRAWRRHSFASWERVTPPRTLGPYPDTLDWLRFRIDNAYRLMRWRVETLRAADPDHRLVAHGIASTLTDHAPGATDEWRAAAEVETWGFTWVASRKGSEPWKQWQAVDLVRAGSAGKPFWHAEAQAGPLWMQPQVVDRPREDGRISEPEDVRLWNLTSFAGGATGILYPRWRPLLDGPLFGAFGAYGLDGGRTARSQMASRVARWANAPEQAALWDARPVRGDLGILVALGSQHFCYAQQGTTDYYAQSARGAYQGFFEHNVQADWVLLNDLDGDAELSAYRVLYLPFPIHLTGRQAARLRAWVDAGGTLISEACPAYWGDGWRVGARQPNLGLDALFGARETYVEFTPDLLSGLRFAWQGSEAPGGVFLQAYEPTSGTAVGHYTGDVAGPATGRVAAVEHRFGEGKTLLFGTFPGYGHYHYPSASSRR